MTYIYVLVDPRTSECRYVGKADKPKDRLCRHLWSGEKSRTHKTAWIKALVAAGVKPEMVVVETVFKAEAAQCEQWWIAYMRSLGARLTNGTDGGDGMVGHIPSKETRARRSEALKNPSAETRQKLSKVHKGKIVSAETRQKLSDAAKRRAPISDDVRARMSAGQKKREPASEETRRKISAIHKGKPKPNSGEALAELNRNRVWTEDARLRVSVKSKNLSDVTRKKMSEAGKGKVKSEATRQRMRDAWVVRKGGALV